MLPSDIIFNPPVTYLPICELQTDRKCQSLLICLEPYCSSTCLSVREYFLWRSVFEFRADQVDFSTCKCAMAVISRYLAIRSTI